MLRYVRMTVGELRNPGVHEKIVYRAKLAVPRTNTGALVEKTKT